MENQIIRNLLKNLSDQPPNFTFKKWCIIYSKSTKNQTNLCD